MAPENHDQSSDTKAYHAEILDKTIRREKPGVMSTPISIS